MRNSLLYLRNLEVSVLNVRGLRGLFSTFLVRGINTALAGIFGTSTGSAFTSVLTGAFTGVLAVVLRGVFTGILATALVAALVTLGLTGALVVVGFAVTLEAVLGLVFGLAATSFLPLDTAATVCLVSLAILRFPLYKMQTF